jgi:hypothetical protein
MSEPPYGICLFRIGELLRPVHATAAAAGDKTPAAGPALSAGGADSLLQGGVLFSSGADVDKILLDKDWRFEGPWQSVV